MGYKLCIDWSIILLCSILHSTVVIVVNFVYFPHLIINRFCGGDLAQLPHPGVDWRFFVSKIKECNKRTDPIFDPLKDAMRPWVDIDKLNKTYQSENAGSAAQRHTSVACCIM